MIADKLLSRLEKVSKPRRGDRPDVARQWMACCPSHEDRKPSLSIGEKHDGSVLLRCFAGCDVEAIVGAVGLDLSDLFPPRERDPSQPARSIRKPWRASDVVSALRGELHVAGVILADVATGREIGEADRERAREAVERIGAFLDELEHAH